jgi:hypothetical protein
MDKASRVGVGRRPSSSGAGRCAAQARRQGLRVRACRCSTSHNPRSRATSRCFARRASPAPSAPACWAYYCASASSVTTASASTQPTPSSPSSTSAAPASPSTDPDDLHPQNDRTAPYLRSERGVSGVGVRVRLGGGSWNTIAMSADGPLCVSYPPRPQFAGAPAEGVRNVTES